MNNRQNKCPACGLTNFREAAECQWCALALRGRARNELVDDAPPPAPKPWGMVLMILALLFVGGGILWHVSRKSAEREALAAEAAEKAEAEESAKSRKRAGPPQLSGRSPGEPRDPALRAMDEALEKQRRETQRYMEENGLTPEAMRQREQEALRRYAERQREAAQRRTEERRARAEEEPPPPPDIADDP